MKKLILLFLFGLFFNSVAFSQSDVYWRSDAGTSNWWDSNNPWYRNCDGYWIARPDYNVCSSNSTTTGGNYVHFDNNNNPSMTVNGDWFKLLTLTFETTATSVRTLNAYGSGGLSFIASTSYLTNLSTANHVFNTGIGIDNASLIINAYGGSFTFNNPIYINANSLTFTGSYNQMVSGVISGTGGNLTKSGSGTLTLNATNIYTGLTTVSAGILQLNSTSGTTIPATNNVTVSGGTLQISSNQTINNLDLSGGGSLTIDPSITLTITGTYAGGTGTINNQGTIILQGTSAQSFPGSSTVINNGTANQMTNLTIDNSTGVNLDNSFTVSGALTINTGKFLSLNAGKQLTVNTTLTNNGTLNLLSTNADGTATILTPASIGGSGTTNVQQYLTLGRNWYISSPVASAATSIVTVSSAGSLWSYYEPSAGWVTTDTYFGITKGYIANMASSGAVTFTGEALNTGDITTPTLSRTGTIETGFNLIGNPYPSYASWNDATKTKVLTSIWYRSKSTGTYLFQTYNSTGQVGTLGGSELIPPMQSFWVRTDVSQPGDASVTFKNGTRSHQDQSVTTNRLKAPAAASTTQQVLRLQVSNGVTNDEAIVLFNPNASNGYDAYDSEKMSNNDAATPEIYTMAGTEQVAINGLNSITTNPLLPLGFTTGTSNTFTIKATEVTNFDADTKIVLQDNLLNTQQDLTDGTAYTFTSDVASNTSRFSVVFKSIGVTTGAQAASVDQAVVIYKNANNQIAVNCNGFISDNAFISVYNALGQKLEVKKITGATTVIGRTFTSGVYMVTVNNGGTSTTKRVILN
jgi:autotransporter-associated beta strand protein